MTIIPKINSHSMHTSQRGTGGNGLGA
jgi:hypothetical protein